ncbi:MAG: peptidylprolyl isomerase [Bacteroidota bacterium]
MALIGKIRNNSWILIIAIALGLGGFLIMDMVSAGQGPGGGLSQLVVGKVNGEKVRRQEFEKVFGLRFNGSAAPTYQNRNTLWDWYIENQLLQDEADALGLGVSRDEISELEFGQNPSPIIRRNFPNPQQPGAVNRQQLDYFKGLIENNTLATEIQEGRISPQFPDFWRMQRDMIVKDRIQSKLQGLISKAMYTPTWMAEMGYAEQNQTVDFLYIKIPYAEIANESVTISDGDLQAYLNANAVQYERKQEERVLDYVVFDVLPTSQDSSDIRDTLSVKIAEFEAAVDGDSTFVLREEGIITPAYSSKEELSTGIADTVMNMPIGKVYGPYSESGEYRLVKVIDRATMADSADTRHILLSAQTPDQFAEANTRADSIINVLNAGTTPFDSLVVAFSQDPGSASNGGVYENVLPNQFVPEFNRVLFITGSIGPLYKVRTSYGIHIVEILRRSETVSERANVAFLRTPIVPSKDTQDNLFQDASEFIANNRSLDAVRAAAQENPQLRVVSTPAFDNSAYIIGDLGFSNDTKDAVCWAFASDPGDVSPSVYTFSDNQRYYDNKYVVIGLKDVLEPGIPNVDEVRADIEAVVLAEKKTASIATQVQGKALQSLTGQFAAQIDTITNAAFDRPSMPTLGNEPKVIAIAVGLEQGQTSGAIQGESGVFVIQTIRKSAIGQATNLPLIRQRMSRTAQGHVASSFMATLRDGAEVEDNRNTYECN